MRRVLLLIALLLAPLSAQAGSLAAVGVGGSSAAASCAALSLSTTPSNGWSMGRKLNSSFSGSAAQLILTGGTTQNIGFVNGCFDTASATTFCTTTCHVKVIFDQYGSVDFTFASFATAPVYTASCINSRPCMDNTGAPGTATSATNNDLAFTGDMAEAAVILDNSVGAEGGYWGNSQTGSPFNGIFFGPSTQIANFQLSFYHDGTWGNCSNSLTVGDNAVHFVAISRASGAGTCRVDGTTASNGTSTSSTTGVVAHMFGGVGGGTYTGKLSEGVTFGASTGDLAGYRTSAQAFWNTP
jgi:hypothetical protein